MPELPGKRNFCEMPPKALPVDLQKLRCRSARQTEDFDPAVLKEMAIEREGAADSPRIENRKGNRVT